MEEASDRDRIGVDRFDRVTYPFPPVRYSLRERADGCAALLGLSAALVVVTAFAVVVPQRGRWYEEFLGTAVLGAAIVLCASMFAVLFRLVGWWKPTTLDNRVGWIVRALVGTLERADRRRHAPALGARREEIEAFLADHREHPWSPEIRRLLDEVDRRIRDYPSPPERTRGRAMKEAVEDGLRDLRFFAGEHPLTAFVAILLVLGTLALSFWVSFVLPFVARIP